MLYFFVSGLFFFSWSHLFPITVPVITFTPNPPSPSSQLALPNSSRDIISWDDEQLSSRITADAGRLANKAVSTRLVGLWHWVREGGMLIGWHTARACGSLSPLLWCLGTGGGGPTCCSAFSMPSSSWIPGSSELCALCYAGSFANGFKACY